jgi:shikimate kinase
MEKIYLIGYMGSGKTSVGGPLAKRLDRSFFDLDKLIEEKTGKTIQQIFEEDGEAVFRGLEKHVLRHFTESQSRFVLAVGGGTPCFYDNMAFMNRQGLTIYLKMDAASLAFRLVHSKTERPLLKSIGNQDLECFVRQHLREREDMYHEAGMVVNALGMSSARICDLAGKILNYSG